MNEKGRNKTHMLLYGLTMLISLIILSDFILPGTVFTEEVISIKKKKQQYYNAAQNYHHTYKITTKKHQFLVSEEFAKSFQQQKVSYSVSLIFKEINRYSFDSFKESSIHSLRIFSGLILPLIVIFVILAAHKFKRNMNTLIFVLQVMILANFIILML